MTRADQRRAHGPYQAAIPARLTGRDYRPPAALAAALEDAAVEVARYHAALTAYRAGEPDVIVGLAVEATFRAVTNGRALAAELHEVRERWRTAVTARRDSAVWRVADLFLARPVLDAAQVAAATGVGVTNVHRHLERLSEAGVQTPFPLHRRGRAWRADEVLRALDAFSARAGRRTRS